VQQEVTIGSSAIMTATTFLITTLFMSSWFWFRNKNKSKKENILLCISLVTTSPDQCN
jgi:hypothetical protein